MAALHAVIAEELRARIRGGELAPGASLPSEAQLCARYGVSRGPVRQAISVLRAEGLVGGGRGKPPVVRGLRPAQPFDQLLSFSAWARGLDQTPGARTVELARRTADPEAADRLELTQGDPVFQLLRVRTLDGRPVMVERATFVESVGRLLVDADLDGGSIYAQLAERGVEFAAADQTIEAVAAGAQDAGLLRCPIAGPLLEVRRLAHSATGEPLEWSCDRYRGDAFAISLHVDVDPRSGLGYSASSTGTDG